MEYPVLAAPLREFLTPLNTIAVLVTALFVTLIIKGVWRRLKTMLKYPAQFSFSSKDIDRIIERCNDLFPKQTLLFKGKSFKRGMRVRVTTLSKKTFEGELVGVNSDNILCVITKSSIAADVLENICVIEEIAASGAPR